jgi:hypothetical protein
MRLKARDWTAVLESRQMGAFADANEVAKTSLSRDRLLSAKEARDVRKVSLR